jgi:aryl-phospho-beta-D-glucosidase BglC (GH1 family)
MDKIIEYATSKGLRILLDRHSSKIDNFFNEDRWFIPGDTEYTEQRWIEDWEMLALRYRGNPAVIGADLWNEPKLGCLWEEWKEAAQRAGNAIHAVNPDWLIVVEGTQNFNGESYWWGGNLQGVRSNPVVLNNENKLVYSAHDYPSSVFEQSWFSEPNYPANLASIWNRNWGYIFEEKIAPVIIGEFGTKLESVSDKTWLSNLISYMDRGGTSLGEGEKGISFTFWCYNPNSHDTGGMLNDDWITVNTEKMGYLKDSLEPLPVLSTSQQRTITKKNLRG